jgi:hypothetical protein
MQRTHGKSKELLNLTYINNDEMIKLYGEPTQGFKNLSKDHTEQQIVSLSEYAQTPF